MQNIKYVRLDKVISPEFDARLTKDPEADDDLRESIRELGVLEPLIVKDTNKGYEIIAGNRRFEQATRAGLTAVPCLISKATGAEADKIQLHENIKRLPLSHVDQAYTFAHLIKKYKMTEQQVATIVGKSIAYVSQHLSLLQTEEVLLQAVQDGRINFSAARELMRCQDKDESERLQALVEKNGASTDVIRTWVNESNRESDLLEPVPPSSLTTEPPGQTQLPMYPCAMCDKPTLLTEIKILRICHGCNFAFFSEIEKEKMKIRKNAQVNEPTTP